MHTPGPWELGELEWDGAHEIRNIEADEGWICSLEGATPDGQANANLISAAPDMLAALEYVDSMVYFPSKVRAAVQQAIAKAKGDAP